MYKTGLAVITKGLTENNLKIVYKFAKTYVNQRLYLSVKGFTPFNSDWKLNISTCYSTANKICPDLDIRLLLPYSDDVVKKRDISVIICDNIDLKHEVLTKFFNYASNDIPCNIFSITGDGESIEEQPNAVTPPFTSVCLGGTFDRLHNGHKVLLSLSALLTNRKLFCGVSSEEMVKHKCLTELIEPLEDRIKSCLSFLEDVRPGIDYTVKQIDHGFGPTITDPDFDCIVGSMETKKGCDQINDIRAEKGYPPLTIDLIDIIDEGPTEGSCGEVINETKVSSSLARLKLLGETLKTPKTLWQVGRPYIIGLTGGIACGKSSIANKLRSFGAEVIDCDKLGHEAYRPGTTCFEKLVKEFGPNIVNNDSGEINRANLGAIVFKDPSQMRRLTDIVWPEIGQLARSRISELSLTTNGRSAVIVIDAAVLLDAGWHDFCDEIWVSFVPRAEAVIRIQDRNKLTAEQAEKRIDSQKPNRFYVESANVVFCTLWSYEFTHRQLTTAWANLTARLTLCTDIA